MQNPGRMLLCGAALAALAGSRAPAQCRSWAGGYQVPGTNGEVHAAVVFDDGSGPALYLGGKFDTAGDVPARNAVRWDGQNWSPLGDGPDQIVFAVSFIFRN